MKYAVVCNDYNDDSFLNPDRVYDCCNQVVDFNYDDIYGYTDVLFYGEDKKRYYVICPNCGHIIWIDESICNNDDSKVVDGHKLFKKNILLSELIYMEYADKLSLEEKNAIIRKRINKIKK